MERSNTFIAIPPGETIKEQLSFRGMSQKEFAIRMDLSEKHVTNLLKGKVHLTSDVAVRLETVLGTPAIFWENLEAIYRENLIKVAEENRITADTEILENLPYPEMVKYGWIPRCKNKHDKLVALRKFFEVSNLQLTCDPRLNRIACRRKSTSERSDYALLAWAQKAKLEARNIETKPINLKGLNSSLSSIRAMTTMSPEKFCPELIKLFADNGVAVIFLPLIKGSFIHGVSFYDGNKIVVGLTVRGKYADVFWFSLFHEIAHIIYGHIGQANGTSENDEKRADLFACETLIPSLKLQSFIKTGIYTAASLKEFADSINIDVGILVGRLQHDNIIGYQQFTRLKKKYELK